MMKKIAISVLILLPFILFAFNKSNVSINPVYHKSQRLKVNPVSGAVKICALRISFPEDDNDATTGDGRFLMSADISDTICQSFRIDPPPHKKAYFKDHIRAAANYFYNVSKGHAVIDTVNSEVYPLIDSLTFQVSQKMDYYHPFLQEDSIDVRLARLFQESVLKADSAGIDFSQYEIVIIFHAGVGQDFDLFLDPTPYDIPSAYLNLNDFRMAFAPDNPNYEGIAVENSSFFIKEGIILPETQNHLLFSNWEDVFGDATSPCEYQIGLNGTFAFMMGFYWGLPSLYDTETGATGIGKFGLMDQGSANLNGLIPAVPSAWSRVFLGWEDPVIADVDQIVNLHHVETTSDTTVWKVPINDTEYFLVENRYASVRPGVSLDSIQYRIYIENGEDEWPSIFPLIIDSIGAVFSEQTGVLLSVPRYDVGLPGSGLLIWHIDESVINPNLAENRINVNRERRGVDLEEGDGAQDLGYPSQMLGASVDIGWFFDPWFAGNEGFWDMNPEYPEDEEKRVGFTDYTNPSSKSNDYAYTGICIDSIGPAGEIMNFRIKREKSLDNFPILLSSDLELSAPLAIDLVSNDNSNEFIVVSDTIYLFDFDGNILQKVKLPINVRLQKVCSSAFYKRESDNILFVLCQEIDSSLTVSAWSLKDRNIGLLNYKNIPDSKLTSNILLSNGELLFGTENLKSEEFQLNKYLYFSDSVVSTNPYDKLFYFIAGGGNNTFTLTDNGDLFKITSSPFGFTKIGQISSVPIGEMVVGYINEGTNVDAVACSNDGIYLLIDPDTDDNKSIFYPLRTYYPNPILSDIDGDDKVEIVIADSQKVYAFTSQMILESNFPISIPNQYIGKCFDPYMLTNDVNGDGVLDIISNINNIGVIAFNKSGKVINGFPIAFPNIKKSTISLFNSSKGSELIAVSNNGKELIGTLIDSLCVSENSWLCYGCRQDRSFFYDVKTKVEEITSRKSLLDKKKTFNWPNPVKESTTTIRYFPNRDCNISIDIYDLAGDFVDSFKNSHPVVGDYNEIDWNVTNVESGVYFAVVKATSGSKTDSKIVKIMVIK